MPTVDIIGRFDVSDVMDSLDTDLSQCPDGVDYIVCAVAFVHVNAP